MDTPTPTPTPTTPTTRAPVLVVEDDDVLGATLRLVLESAGYEVADSATVADALAHLRTMVAPQVVLLDFLLQQGNADLLLGAIDGDARLQRHAYILIPARPPTQFPDKVQRLIRAHCIDVVLKPFEVTTVLEAVARAVTHLRAPSPSPPPSPC